MLKTSVKVAQGIVRGYQAKLPNGKSFLKFQGIPYAKKPRRFQDPQKLIEFETDEIDCTKEGNECLQRSTLGNEIIGSEDCLYLNVYIPDSTSLKKFPVMFWIHGGAFAYGSGSEEAFSPEYLLMEDVIVVTINYRLHALGFLMLPSMGINGNAGLKDQQMALEWVYNNISNFNGDPEKICLFGESAGAVSVHLHVLNEESRGMISSAICQSGCALNNWAIQKDAIGRTKHFAKLLGCTSDNDRDIYDTLMKAPHEELLKQLTSANTLDDRRRNLNITFKPSIEINSKNAFMSKSPVELIKIQKDQIKIPIIFGTTEKEGIIQASYMIKSLPLFNKDPTRMIPISIDIDTTSDKAKQLGIKIKNFYFDGDVDEKHIENFIDLMTDIHFLMPQVFSSELHTLYQKNSKQYLYEFRYDGELNLFKKLLQMENQKGACHGDDLFYLFGQKNIEMEVDEDSSAGKIRKLMCSLWANFARNSDIDHPLWIQSEKHDELNYLILDENVKIEKNINKKRMNFWRLMHNQHNKDYLKAKL